MASSTTAGAEGAAGAAAKAVLVTLAAAQFVMILDSSVMNVSIATVAKDLDTTVTGIQTAITMYTLVMASLMITGGKMGAILGRKRAFTIGCVIYASGSFTTALSPNLPVLLFGWSFLEGVGAALVMPAIVALVASNFVKSERPRAYGIVTAGGAIAVALGPLIGGLFTTYWSWRYVFVGEVLIIGVVLLLNRRTADTPKEEGARLDLVGTALSALGLGLIVYGVLRAGSWGFVQPKPDAPTWLGLSPVIWLILGGGAVLLLFLEWEKHRRDSGQAALLDPAILRVRLLRSGLVAFFFQYLLQAGLFFAVPLFLSIALGLVGHRHRAAHHAAVDHAGDRRGRHPEALPEGVAPARHPLRVPHAVRSAWSCSSPRSTRAPGPRSRSGRCSSPGSASVRWRRSSARSPCPRFPTSRAARSAGSRTPSPTSGSRSGPRLSGAILMSALTASFFSGIASNPAVPNDLTSKAQTELTSGVPFISDADLEKALDDAGRAPADRDRGGRRERRRPASPGCASRWRSSPCSRWSRLFLSGSIPTNPVGSEPGPRTPATSDPSG